MKKKRFILEPYRGKHTKRDCPNCGHRTFTYYIDVHSNNYLPPEFGICNRFEKCGYKLIPNKNNYNSSESVSLAENLYIPQEEKTYYNVIPEKIFTKSFENKFNDNLSLFLINTFGDKSIKVLDKYKVGHSSRFNGASTVFWQISLNGEIRAGKIMKYTENGKRDKSGEAKINWVHSLLKNKEYVLKQCFFGEHLLSSSRNMIYVVESEKTALIGAILHPKYTWISSGALYGLGDEKLEVLKGRNCKFIPDKGKAYKIWKERIASFPNEKWEVSDFVEKEKSLDIGDDIGDYFLKNYDGKQIRH